MLGLPLAYGAYDFAYAAYLWLMPLTLGLRLAYAWLMLGLRCLPLAYDLAYES